MQVLRTSDSCFAALSDYPFEPHYTEIIADSGEVLRIHHIDEGVDTGDIIVQKPVIFEDLTTETLGSSYQKLHQEIQALFYENWATIKAGKSERKVQSGEGTAHRVKDKIPFLHLLEKDGWDTRVSVLVEYGRHL